VAGVGAADVAIVATDAIEPRGGTRLHIALD